MPDRPPARPKERLYQEIVDRIQRQILSGELVPGDRLPPERDLADTFGVSRTAVREAMKSLAEKGLIDVFVGRGTFVTSLSPERVVESFTLLLHHERENVSSLQEARELVEVPTARLAALRRTEENLVRLEAIMARMEEETRVTPRLVDGDTEFHTEVARAAGNPVLVILSETIVELLRGERLQRRDFDESVPVALAAHRKIARAIAERDAERAARAMAEHLAHVACGPPRADAARGSESVV